MDRKESVLNEGVAVGARLRGSGWWGALFAAAALGLMAVPVARAEPPEFLAQISGNEGLPGEGAAAVDGPFGVGVDSDNGHLFVSDLFNARISEYTAWGFYVRSWGWDVAPDGSAGDTASDEFEICGPTEPEESSAPGLCQAGVEGAGAGQFAEPFGITVDGAANVYVLERGNNRVQKFGPSGQFLLMFGGQVNKTKVEGGNPEEEQNICPPTDVCQAGAAGSAPSYLSDVRGDQIAYDTKNDRLVIGDEGRIQIFQTDGSFKDEIPFEGPLAAFAGKTVNGLDVDKDGRIYFSLSGEKGVYKISSAGEPLAPGEPGGSSFEVRMPRGVAVDVQGNVYAIDDDPTPKVVPEVAVRKFDSTGVQLVPTEPEEEADELFPYIPFQGPSITAIATNFCAGSEPSGNLYLGFFDFGKLSHVDAYGTGPVGCEDPPKRPPEITTQFATSVGREDAAVRAQINPRFWADTTYYVEYGTGRCSVGGCPGKQPISSVTLTGNSINKALNSAALILEGLAPGTTYHFRFAAASTGGGPVYGTDPDGAGPLEADALHGLEGTFKTRAPKGAGSACPNAAFRAGSGSELPDCRAYEMVSPLDKGNADVALWIARNAQFPYFFEINKTASSGARFTYTSATAFGDAKAAPFVSQYMAERGSAGWKSEAISPLRTEPPVTRTATFGNDFEGFSTDLCNAWLRTYSASILAPGAIENFANLYRRNNCVEPATYLPLTTAKPVNREADEYRRLRALSASNDGLHSIFVANAKLDKTDAPNLKGEEELLLYEHGPEGLRFVCYLPSGKPSPQACSAGTAASGSESSLHNAISADGSHIFWTAYSGGTGGGNQPGAPGQIYVRIDGKETVAVSGSKATGPAWYWTAADDGSKAIFAFESGPFADQLYEFDVEAKTPRLIAGEIEGPMGASEDASRIYFASAEDLDEAGPASAGAHNLYLYQAGAGGGSFAFIMELTARDIGGSNAAPSPIDEVPTQRSARVSPDGLHATFTSVASPAPTGFDNTDAESSEPDQEVYLYDAVAKELRCVSCNPTGARPVGEKIEGLWAAARIQGWSVLDHAPRVLSEDGTRVFFESFEALVLRDTNGTWDVYQWEEPGAGTCTTTSETYSDITDGCVDLISSGQSPSVSIFLDADPPGDNVFFSTQSSLVGADYGLNDVYVARVEGGFPEPLPPGDCEGEACQSPPAPPMAITPASESFRENPKARKCPKSKRRVVRKGKVRCVKKRRHRKAHRRKETHNAKGGHR